MINCPKCSSEVLVETTELGNIPLDVCPGCSGIWFNKAELEALLKQAKSEGAADLALINPKPDVLACPGCKNKMSRGGLVNPLLLVDKCGTCGGVWLDQRELGLAKKLLGLSGGDSEVQVARLVPAPAAPVPWDFKTALKKLTSGAAAILGLVGVSYEMYLYFSPATSVSHAPSAGIAVASVVLFAGGIFVLLRGK